MPEQTDVTWPDAPQDLPPPEPAPADWAPPTPVETTIETTEGVEVQRDEEAQMARLAFNRPRRFWGTTFAYLGLWVASILLVDTGQGPTGPLFFLLPLYLITLALVLRTPKKYRGKMANKFEATAWQTKVMVTIVVFLCIYIPFTLVSGFIIPFASLVEYVLFAVLLYALLRLSGRGAGVAPSAAALPPPSHRLHQQVVAPIDDAHYQRTLWLNFNFVEKGKGSRHLAHRLDQVLESNGVADGRREEILGELRDWRDSGTGVFVRTGSERHRRGRDRRADALARTLTRITQELERTA